LAHEPGQGTPYKAGNSHQEDRFRAWVSLPPPRFEVAGQARFGLGAALQDNLRPRMLLAWSSWLSLWQAAEESNPFLEREDYGQSGKRQADYSEVGETWMENFGHLAMRTKTAGEIGEENR